MPKKILLADDSITIQKVVELTFSDGDYEVTAVNNGAKALQKLSEMRPDIILSDIIMPEKNGYEVCEYVKSHPDFRNIPVVLLTGTFEPFDPDRAEKAGCDAVVTKPFESQSLIHKVEELISQARTSAAESAAPAEPPPPAPSPWMEEQSPASTEIVPMPQPPPAEPVTHDADIFSAPPSIDATTEMPFAPPMEHPPAETRAFPSLTPEAHGIAVPPPPPAEESSPWDEPAETPFETPAASAPEMPEPFGAPSEEFGGETRAFPRMTFDQLQQMEASAPPPYPLPEPSAFSTEAPPSVPEPGPWDEPAQSSPFADEPEPAFGGETRAFPKMTFEQLQEQMNTPAPEPPREESPWGEPEPPSQPALGGETRAFPAADFDQIPETPAPAPQEEPLPWSTTPEPFESEPQAAAPAAPPSDDADTGRFAVREPAPAVSPFASTEEADSPSEAAAGAAAAASASAEVEEPPVPPAVLAPEAPSMPIAARGADLTDEQIERIAHRVIELMSDRVVRNIAWEVIPDLAEMVVKERIRQLESEG